MTFKEIAIKEYIESTLTNTCVCRHCGEDFRAKTPRWSVCPECKRKSQRLRSKKWRKENKEKVNKYQKKWRQANPDKVKAKQEARQYRYDTDSEYRKNEIERINKYYRGRV